MTVPELLGSEFAASQATTRSKRSLLEGIPVASAFPLFTSAIICAFLAISLFHDCSSCSTALPHWILLLACVAWIGIAFVNARISPFLAFLVSLFIVSSHITIMAISPPGPCWVCWSVLFGGVGSALILGHSIITNWKAQSKGIAYLITVSLALMAGYGNGVAVNALWIAPLDTQVIQGSSAESNGSGLEVLVLVKRNCSACASLERKLEEIIQNGLASKVRIIDERSNEGIALRARSMVKSSPSYVALFKGKQILSQEGGAPIHFVEQCRLLLRGLPE